MHAEQHNIPFASWIPLSTEYLVFAVLFALIVLLEYGISALRDFSISAVFLGIIGVIYTIDNVYPFGAFTPFQIFVLTTAILAANVLNLIGYQTRFLSPRYGMPVLIAWDSQGRSSLPFAIGWPCSGVESLLIYSVTILLFLQKSNIPWKHRIIYFVIGGIVTCFINILRIVTIFVISTNGGDVWGFYDYYGQLYSISWIASYPFMTVLNRGLLRKIRTGIKDRSGLFKTSPRNKYQDVSSKVEQQNVAKGKSCFA